MGIIIIIILIIIIIIIIIKKAYSGITRHGDKYGIWGRVGGQ